MKLALFDIDETLIRGDSEALWCQYLTENGIRDMTGIGRFMEQYEAGVLDFDAFSRFVQSPLVSVSTSLLLEHRERFLSEEIRPRLVDSTLGRVKDHLESGHVVLAISAAHDFIGSPVATIAGINDGLYTRSERIDGGYTGRVSGTPCFREGKLKRLEEWLSSRGEDTHVLDECWFYTDSHNDLPLLERVGHRVAVRPDPKLRAVAVASGWEVIEG